uniref:Uncharacterized protein n=1 Tax=Panagrolaimus sp. JU765 TaxID=591449 RepID=A0AC34QZH2_9BILA
MATKRRKTEFTLPPPSSPKKPKQSLDPSVISSFGFENEPDDVIAVMEHVSFRKREKPKFEEHVFKGKKKIYSTKHETAPDVTFVGKEDANEYYDYCIVKYNRSRKKVLEIKPASLLRFEGKTRVDSDELKGIKKKKSVNLTADHSITSDNYLKNRQALTSQFGSVQKNKMLEASIRRKVNGGTLSIMAESTFESKNAVEKVDKGDIFVKTESSSMPVPNRKTTIPSQIYEKTLFYTKEEVAHNGEIAQKFFKDNSDVSKLIGKDISPVLAKLAMKVHSDIDNYTECILYLKFLIYAALARELATNTKRKYIYCSQIFSSFPKLVVDECLGENFKAKKDAQQKISYTLFEKDRLFAWFLCLWLVLNNQTVPVTAVPLAVGLAEKTTTKILRALGCEIVTASNDELMMYESSKMAKLVGPPPDELKRKTPRKSFR